MSSNMLHKLSAFATISIFVVEIESLHGLDWFSLSKTYTPKTRIYKLSNNLL